jgi:hypothetical protein
MEAQHMEHDRPFRWTAVLFAILVAGAVGFFAYNAGVAHGIASVAQPIAAPAPGAAVYPPYGFYRPWGFGFGFFFAPFFFFLLFALVMRGLFWGRRWRRHGCYGGGYYGGVPMTFDEWHRQAHDRMTKEPGGPPQDADRSRR